MPRLRNAQATLVQGRDQRAQVARVGDDVGQGERETGEPRPRRGGGHLAMRVDDGDEQAIAIRFAYTLNFTIDAVERERVLAEDEARRLTAARATAPINLTGRVKVAAEPGVVTGAIVSIEGTELEASTDEDGDFTFRGVPEGRVVVVVTSSEDLVVLAGSSEVLFVLLE